MTQGFVSDWWLRSKCSVSKARRKWTGRLIRDKPFTKIEHIWGKEEGSLLLLLCLVTQLWSTLHDLMNCSPLGSSVHGIFQARILEWVSISSSRRSSWFRDQTHLCIYIHTHLLYPFISWWTLRFLHILTIVNNIATNIGVHLSFWITGVFFSDIYTGVEMLGHMVGARLAFPAAASKLPAWLCTVAFLPAVREPSCAACVCVQISVIEV